MSKTLKNYEVKNVTRRAMNVAPVEHIVGTIDNVDPQKKFTHGIEYANIFDAIADYETRDNFSKPAHDMVEEYASEEVREYIAPTLDGISLTFGEYFPRLTDTMRAKCRETDVTDDRNADHRFVVEHEYISTRKNGEQGTTGYAVRDTVTDTVHYVKTQRFGSMHIVPSAYTFAILMGHMVEPAVVRYYHNDETRNDIVSYRVLFTFTRETQATTTHTRR